MSVEVVGFSGSPIHDSNTDRAVKMILEATGLKSEFVKLSDYRVEPCRACLACVKDNRCVVKDDARELADRFRRARAFVLGAYTPYSSLDARSKAFMERMYCLRHKAGLNRGKVGATVVTTACQPGAEGLPPAAETANSQLAFWMMEEGMRHVGSMTILGNLPCIRCGWGDRCEMSGVRMLGGADATVASMGVRDIEKDTDLVRSTRRLGKALQKALEQAEADSPAVPPS